MRNMPKPKDDAESVFRLCISRVEDPESKSRYHAVVPQIKAASSLYEQHASSGDFHLIPQTEALGDLSLNEMVTVYSYRMVSTKQPGRPIYDKIVCSPRHNLCPMCAQRVSATVDHYLPKTRYSALVVNPLNLIPYCAECNKLKLQFVPASKDDRFYHPYFDDLGAYTWLGATIRESLDIVVEFEVRPDASWPISLQRCVAMTFNNLRLASLYSIHAGRQITGMRVQLKRVYASDGASGVRDHLAISAESWADDDRNSWQAALFQALCDSYWFCHTWCAQL